MEVPHANKASLVIMVKSRLGYIEIKKEVANPNLCETPEDRVYCGNVTFKKKHNLFTKQEEKNR